MPSDVIEALLSNGSLTRWSIEKPSRAWNVSGSRDWETTEPTLMPETRTSVPPATPVALGNSAEIR